MALAQTLQPTKTPGRTECEAQGQETLCLCILSPLLCSCPGATQACRTCLWVCMYGKHGHVCEGVRVGVLCHSLNEQ